MTKLGSRSILKKIELPTFAATFVIACWFWATHDTRTAYSILIGATFSYVAFRHLITSQILILSQGRKSTVFVRLILRLFVYATPVMLGIIYERYFNLIIILVCLFTFQISYIAAELVGNYKQYKKRLHTTDKS